MRSYLREKPYKICLSWIEEDEKGDLVDCWEVFGSHTERLKFMCVIRRTSAFWSWPLRDLKFALRERKEFFDEDVP